LIDQLNKKIGDAKHWKISNIWIGFGVSE